MTVYYIERFWQSRDELVARHGPFERNAEYWDKVEEVFRLVYLHNEACASRWEDQQNFRTVRER